MIPDAEITRNYFPPINNEKGWTIGKISGQKLFPGCQIMVSGNSTGREKSKCAENLLRIIHNVPLAAGQAGTANIKFGKVQRQPKDSVKILEVTYPAKGQCTPEYDTLTYFSPSTGSNSKFQAGQFHIIYGRRTRV